MDLAGRQQKLAARLDQRGIDLALITDEDSVYYFSGYCDYLHMDWGRPTILALARGGRATLITPELEREMALARARVDALQTWNDGLGDEWRGPLARLLAGATRVGVEADAIHAVVRRAVEAALPAGAGLADIGPLIAEQRMIKSAEEIALARHAGEVGRAMMDAARETIAAGVPEYEVALAIAAAGTRRAAALIEAHYARAPLSPLIHFLQIMASGARTTWTHHRASLHRIRSGEPVFVCLCGTLSFRRFRLGFDRLFWAGAEPEPEEVRLYEIALEAQAAALAAIRPGIPAEEVHAAYAAVIREAGFDYPFRCGRATGFSCLERPQLVAGDCTPLAPGMVFAVDGSVALPGRFRAQVGDSVVVTAGGWEPLTCYPKTLDHLVLTG